MVDWDAVERLRSRGWDWERIASDPRVEFTAAADSGEPGRQLRVLYYQRRSKSSKKASSDGEGSSADRLDDRPPWSLLRVGFILAPALGLWLLLAYVFPSPVGVYFPAYPWLLVLFLVAVGVLLFSLLRATDKWNTTFRNGVALGVVLGLVISGGFGIAAVSQGCPTLSASGSSLPSEGANPTWIQYSSDPRWEDGSSHYPVFFFYGSIGCPYCSASSWAFYWALEKFGSLEGLQYGHSNPGDIYPSTPELEFVSASYSSQYVAIHILESDVDTNTVPPTPSTCQDQAYVSAYDTVGIPFVVVAGQWVHTNTVVSPASLQPLGLSPQQVLGQVLNESGSAWSLIAPNAYMLTAIMLKATGGQPASILSQNPSVAADYNGL